MLNTTVQWLILMLTYPTLTLTICDVDCQYESYRFLPICKTFVVRLDPCYLLKENSYSDLSSNCSKTQNHRRIIINKQSISIEPECFKSPWSFPSAALGRNIVFFAGMVQLNFPVNFLKMW